MTKVFSLHSLFILIVLKVVVLLFSECKKESKSPIDAPERELHTWNRLYPSYMPLKVGNYWIYERFRVEQHGPSTTLDQFDSVYVVKDTIIRNSQFWIMKKFDFIFSRDERLIRRDSLHYLIDGKGNIQFSSIDFSTEFYRFYSRQMEDTVFVSTIEMNDKDLGVTTAAGTFSTSNMQQTILVYPKFVVPDVNNPRYMNCRYAKNIGIVTETELYLFHADYGTERRLIRFKIN